MRKILLLLVAFGLPCVSLAQANPTAWTNLNSLRAGQKIQIIDTAAKKYSGTFINVSDSSIAFAKISQQDLARADVRTVKLMQNHRLRNSLILGAIGAGIGAGIGAALHRGCAPNSFCFDFTGKALPAGIGAVAGGIGGLTVGAILPDPKTIYDITPH